MAGLAAVVARHSRRQIRSRLLKNLAEQADIASVNGDLLRIRFRVEPHLDTKLLRCWEAPNEHTVQDDVRKSRLHPAPDCFLLFRFLWQIRSKPASKYNEFLDLIRDVAAVGVHSSAATNA